MQYWLEILGMEQIDYLCKFNNCLLTDANAYYLIWNKSIGKFQMLAKKAQCTQSSDHLYLRLINPGQSFTETQSSLAQSPGSRPGFYQLLLQWIIQPQGSGVLGSRAGTSLWAPKSPGLLHPLGFSIPLGSHIPLSSQISSGSHISLGSCIPWAPKSPQAPQSLWALASLWAPASPWPLSHPQHPAWSSPRHFWGVGTPTSSVPPTALPTLTPSHSSARGPPAGKSCQVATGGHRWWEEPPRQRRSGSVWVAAAAGQDVGGEQGREIPRL